MARNIVQKGIDSIKDSILSKSYPKGDTFEMLAPVAVQFIEQLDVTFAKADYKFTISGHAGGMLWTKDISYGSKTNPPPPNSVLGVPVPKQVIKYIRPATDE